MRRSYPCPCCGHLTLSEPPGSYYICLVCFWEDDEAQLRWPTLADGASNISLIDAQRNFVAIGACEERLLRHIRPPASDEPREAGWRPIADHDNFEVTGTKEADWPENLTVLYWWRPTFWRPR